MQKFLQVIVAVLFSGIVIPQLSYDRKFDELGLGESTTSYYPKSPTHHVIHFRNYSQSEIRSFKKGWEARGQRDIILILGNSQAHGINQMKQGDHTYSQKLFEDWAELGFDVITISYPNANIQEFYLTVRLFTDQFPVKNVVIPTFYDDMREDGIRKAYLSVAFESPQRIETKYEYDQDLVSMLTKTEQAVDSDTEALNNTPQKKVEQRLDDLLSEYLSFWGKRPQMRSEILLSLYRLRNLIFGIDATTERKKIPISYNHNINAFEALLSFCQDMDIQTLIYIPPIRQDYKIPYDLIEYQAFKKEIENICNSYQGAHFRNFESVVPSGYWGQKSSTGLSDEPEIDFMHFQQAGHEITGEFIHTSLMEMAGQP